MPRAEFDHGLSVGRHRDRMGIADEQPASGLLLQLADVLADRRLPQAEALGGPGETPGLGDRQEGLKQDRIQHGFLSESLLSGRALIIAIYDYNNSCNRTSQ